MAPPTSNTQTGGTNDAFKLTSDKRARIFVPSGLEAPFARKVVPFACQCPLDEPARESYTRTQVDRRLLGPLTLRFKATMNLEPIGDTALHDHIRRGLWRQIQPLLNKVNPSLVLPSITFDKATGGSSAGWETIDLVFDSPAAFLAIAPYLVSIQLEGGDPRIWSLWTWTNSLSGDDFIIDCIKLPVSANNGEAVMQSFDTVVASIGKVIGVGKLVMRTTEFKLADESEGIARVYVKLTQASRTTPLSSLVLHLPTHFNWQGVDYNLYYTGRELQTIPTYSAKFPIHASFQDNRSSTSATVSPATSAPKTEIDQASATKKRRQS
ncbi:hypothetical protein BDZ90DRAFT_262961 [Jaminaea rosea]|uniref:Uncharacterized protein n=1 Tax=Jaminaea rosea TaxID=1569628 RepID=A0A316ULE3_9BASI|nr:hypothetical protein BDZ90DRAFT_262961 [Jaminaea rosea]PWN24743.1 hypothetical protein BDZ90DRAFT_262961 [Jaminaea rosea]